MKYAVDRILDGIVTLENIETKEIKNVSIDKFPKRIKEGNIVLESIKYTIDKEEETKRRKKIKNKLDRVKKNK